MSTSIHEEEVVRLAAPRQYHSLDTLPEPASDDSNNLASSVGGKSLSVVSLREHTLREQAFSVPALPRPEDRPGEDAHAVVHFADNLFVSGDTRLRFCADAPLLTSNGQVLGTLSMIARAPRSLASLSRAFEKSLESRRKIP